MDWKEYLIHQVEGLVDYGQGKLSFNVGPAGKDKTSVFIECGKARRFVIEQVKSKIESDLDD